MAAIAASTPLMAKAQAVKASASAQPLRSAFLGANVSRTHARLSAKVQARKALRATTSMSLATSVKTDEALVMKSINAIRFLAIDGVEKANSGHPGLPMGCAPMAYVLYNEAMTHNPADPTYFNRDRFVLSAGHGCMLQYSLMHLTGYDGVKLEDLQQFRQWGSRTPGHPENFETPGIEVTTGPLGAGIANAVGLALSEAHLAARFNKPDMTVVDHYTYCILGDGCNMEGVSNEAASLAGHWGLGKLIALYDDNKISIDGHTDISFTEDVCARYEAMGWHVQHVEDGNHDLVAIRAAIDAAKAVTDKPSLIKVSTLIGYGSPNKADSHDVHGAPLGKDEVQATRENLKWDYAPFEIPEDVTANFKAAGTAGAAAQAEWNKTMEAYAAKYPEDAKEFKGLISMDLPEGWEKALPTYTSEDAGIATRLHSQTMLNALAPALPGLIGGSADLAPSNMTLMKMFGDFQKDTPAERNVRFGVREHGMGCIANGIALHNSGLIPYCATFFIFTDYMRAAMRISALSECGTIYVMTHDSIGLGEDGPTHQPIEHLASFRAMPNMNVFRPCDGNETAGAYKVAVENRKAPTLIVCSRQGMPNWNTSSIANTEKGAYTIAGDGEDFIIIGTGSEVEVAKKAHDIVAEKTGKSGRVVSMPSWEQFEKQSAEYKESILPKALYSKTVSVEAGSTFGWAKYAGAGQVGHDDFGASAPAPILYKEFGITAENVASKVEAAL